MNATSAAIVFALLLALLFFGIVIFPMTLSQGSLSHAKKKQNRDKPGLMNRFWLWSSWRIRPWELGPIATEVVISRALAEPRLASTILAALRLATKHRDMHDLEALNWIVPGAPDDIFWCVDGKRFEVVAKWPNGMQIGSQGLTIPNELIPAAIRASLADRRLGDLFDLPFARPDHRIEEYNIRRTENTVILDIFRDQRDLGTIEQTLKAIDMTRKVPGLKVERRAA